MEKQNRTEPMKYNNQLICDFVCMWLFNTTVLNRVDRCNVLDSLYILEEIYFIAVFSWFLFDMRSKDLDLQFLFFYYFYFHDILLVFVMNFIFIFTFIMLFYRIEQQFYVQFQLKEERRKSLVWPIWCL